jgi:hypothetical protein
MIQDFLGIQEMHLESLVLLHFRSTTAQILQGLRTLKRVTAIVQTQILECFVQTVLPHGSNSCHRHKVNAYTGTEIGGIADVISSDIRLNNKHICGLSRLLCEER